MGQDTRIVEAAKEVVAKYEAYLEAERQHEDWVQNDEEWGLGAVRVRYDFKEGQLSEAAAEAHEEYLACSRHLLSLLEVVIQLDIQPKRGADVATGLDSLQLQATEYTDQHSFSADFRNPANRSVNTGLSLEYAYGILGLLLGFCTILGGLILVLRGATGSVSWAATILGAKSTLNDAAPGVVLFVVGLFIIWVTKPAVRLTNRQPISGRKRRVGGRLPNPADRADGNRQKHSSRRSSA